MSTAPLAEPRFRKGLEIFESRPLSLVAALIVAVVVCVVSFLLLFFPVIAAYFYAVRQSRREEYFIDLENVLRTSALIFAGIKRYFIQSYVLGILGLLPALALLLAPILPLELAGEEGQTMSLVLQILFLPAFFLMGSLVLYGYPYLIATNSAVGSIRYAVSKGKSKFFKVIALGFVLLIPIPGAIIHLLMGLTYPLLASWAVSDTADDTERLLPFEKKERTSRALGLFGIAMLGGLLYLCINLWGGPGFVAWLGIFLGFVLAGILANWNFAVILFASVLGFVAILIGGMIFTARQWGEPAGFLWVGVCMLFFILFLHSIKKRMNI
jgi:hypothetical protein